MPAANVKRSLAAKLSKVIEKEGVGGGSWDRRRRAAEGWR